MFPMIGGHEGAGIVTEVGPGVDTLAVGDHVAMSFIPACGRCFWCASGRQYLCDLGMTILAGPMLSDGEWRHHLDGQKLNRMTQLGTFSETRCWPTRRRWSRSTPTSSLRAAALISCGISTGFGSAVDRAKVKPGETVVVVGCGGVGSGAIQGAKIAGARYDHRRRPAALQGGEGQGDRCDPRGRLHRSTPPACFPISPRVAWPTWSSSPPGS